MAIKRPDIYEHNNPNYAFTDSDFVRGGFRTAVADLTALYALAPKLDQLKEHSTIVYVTGEAKYYILVDIANVGNVNGWNEFQTGGGTGTITGATNGLSTSGANIILGGTLLSGTTINADNNDLSITNINEFQIKTSGDTTVLGIDNDGLLFSFTGGSISFDDGGGLKYGGDYSANYTAQSIPDVNFVTGQTNQYLKLDQNTPQNVTGGQPVFDEGMKFGQTPSTSQTSGHTAGRMYYDEEYQTISVDIGDETTLQIGQESLRYVYNSSGSIISNGAVVRDNGVHSGSGVDTVTITLAIATGITVSSVIGIATQDIGINDFGYITTKGNINGLDTLNDPQYAGMTIGDELYLSAAVAGGVTNVRPSSPNVGIALGRLLTKSSTNGKIFVEIYPAISLNDLIDVNVPAPSLDNVLKWNGNEWINAAIGSTSASVGINYYYETPIINSRTSPAGLSQNGTSGNGIQVATISKTPVTTGGTIIVAGLSASDNRAFSAWESINPIQRTTIDAGLWEFYDYVSVDTVVGTTYLIHGMYQIVPITGSTVTTTGVGANSRTATISSNEFTGSYFNPDTINSEASYLQTPSGIYQITASASTNSVTITVPTGYVNESSVSGKTWNMLFTGSTESIENVTPLYQTKIIAPAFSISETDKLGQISYVSASGAYTLSLSYNGTSAASFFITPLVTLHNDLAGLQGGTGDYRGHITLGQNTIIDNTSNINTGDETKSTIESKLTGTIITHTHPYSGLTGKPDLSQYQTISGFTGYTSSIQPVIDNAITGATNFGTGTPIYSGNTGRDLQFNTITGSGGTTVQKVGDNIIINTPTISGSQQYSGETPSAVDLCGIYIGYQLTGKTVSCIIQDLLVPELYGTVTAPSTSISLTYSGILEIGCNISQTVCGTFSQGSILPQYCSISNKRSGLPNAYKFTGTGMPVPFQLCTVSPATQNIASYNVISGLQSWGVCTSYDAGQPALGSKGTEYAAALSSGCTIQDTCSITGILPWYWGTKASGTITGADVAAGTKTVAVVGASTPITYNATTEYLWFAAPAGTYTNKTKWWVCAANAGTIGGTGNLWAASCSVAVTSAQACWAACNYDVYVTCGITTTAAGIPMCLYY